MQEKIVITGGPGTGKSTILKELIRQNYTCMPEISREITIEAQSKGVEQLFLDDPLFFSEQLLKKREEQFFNADQMKSNIIFFDRGIPDIVGYMIYSGIDFPDYFWKSTKDNRYSTVFILPPWKEIYSTDNERYEDFKQSVGIHNHLKKIYLELGYDLIEVPKATLKQRIHFMLNSLKVRQ